MRPLPERVTCHTSPREAQGIAVRANGADGSSSGQRFTELGLPLDVEIDRVTAGRADTKVKRLPTHRSLDG
jgi:hypothetical protein